jgi:hypothetical protein
MILWVVFPAIGCQTNFDTREPAAQLTPTNIPERVGVIVTVHPVDTLEASLTAYPGVDSSLDPELESILSLVKNDLIQKTGVVQGDIHILAVEAVEWPDSSLGCGKPGAIYLPVITPGFRILLEAHGQTYSYHTDKSSRFILCGQPPPIKDDPTR